MQVASERALSADAAKLVDPEGDYPKSLLLPRADEERVAEGLASQSPNSPLHCAAARDWSTETRPTLRRRKVTNAANAYFAVPMGWKLRLPVEIWIPALISGAAYVVLATLTITTFGGKLIGLLRRF